MSYTRQSSLKKSYKKKRTMVSRPGEPEIDGEDSSVVKVRAAGIDPAVQSTIFKQIRDIPTGSYFQNQGRNDEISQEQIRQRFKGIFQSKAFDDPDEEDNGKLPKILQSGPMKSPRMSKVQNFKSPRSGELIDRSTSNDKSQSKRKDSGLQAQRTVRNHSMKKVEDPVMNMYQTAHRQIKENIARAQIAVTSQSNISGIEQLRNSSGEQITLENFQKQSGQTMPKKGNFAAGTSGDFSKLPRGATFSTIQGVTEDQSKTSTLLGTLAGAKNSKYKVQFRKMNQGSVLLPQTDSRQPSSKSVFPRSMLNETLLTAEQSRINQQSGLITQTRNTMASNGQLNKFGSPIAIHGGAFQRGLGLSTPQRHTQGQGQFLEPLDNQRYAEATMNRTLDFGGNALNLVDKNINNVREYKFAKVEAFKESIGEIHQNLMMKKPVTSGGNISLTSIQKQLSPKMKDIFLKQASKSVNFNHLFNDMNSLNGFFLDIVDSVCSYKVDLGIILQKMVESYNSIFLQQFGTFYEVKLQKEIEYEQAIAHYNEKTKETEGEKEILLQKQQLCAHATDVKDSEIKRLLEVQANLEKQIEELKNIIHQEKQEDEAQKEFVENQQAEIDSKQHMKKDHDRQKRVALKQNPMSSKHLLDPANIEDFKDALEMSTDRIENRNEVVQNLYEVIKSMLTYKLESKKVQTDQACMNNAIMYEYYSYGSSSSERGSEEKQKEKDEEQREEKLHRMMKERGINPNESDAEQYDSQIKITTHEGQESESEADQVHDLRRDVSTKKSKNTIKSDPKQSKASIGSKVSQSIQKSTSKLSGSGEQSHKKLSHQESKSFSVAGSKKTGIGRSAKDGSDTLEPRKSQFNILQPPVAAHNLSLKQLGVANQKQLRYINDLFDTQSNKIKRKKMIEENVDPTKLQRGEVWKISNNILVFIQNRIIELEGDPALLDSYELMPWFQFKDAIFDIYDHRIKYAPELNGSVNSNYCSLNEHILMFFLDKYRVRAKAEEKILDLLFNLRYYYDFWQRAKQFAYNLDLIHFPQALNLQKGANNDTEEESMDKYGDPKRFDQPHAYIKDDEIADNDIFSQEFFLHIFSLFSQDRLNFLESREGMTYVRVKHHDKIAGKILPLIRGPSGDLQKWNLKIRRMVKRLKNQQGVEGDYLDLDLIIGMMLEDYKNQRRNFQKDLQKQFLQSVGSNIGEVDLDTFIEIVNQGLPHYQDTTIPDNPLILFPSKMAQIRAYIFTCTGGDENSNIFSDDMFVAGCCRYAIENPVPSVSLRCSLYGNTRDIMTALAEAEKKYGKPNIKVDQKLFTDYSMGLPLKNEFKRKSNMYLKLKMTDEEREEELDDKRKPTVNVNETPKPSLEAVNEFKGCMKNMKLQFHKQSPQKEDHRAQVGKMKFKIQTLRKSVEQEELKHHKFLPSKESIQNLNPGEKREVQKPNANKVTSLTQIQFGLSKKQIIVPSFETTALIFQQHFLILRELKYKIDLLKQAYYGQMDRKKTWEQVDQIITVLNTGCHYLDFPLDKDIGQYLTDDDRLESIDEKLKSMSSGGQAFASTDMRLSLALAQAAPLNFGATQNKVELVEKSDSTSNEGKSPNKEEVVEKPQEDQQENEDSKAQLEGIAEEGRESSQSKTASAHHADQEGQKDEMDDPINLQDVPEQEIHEASEDKDDLE